MKVFYLISKRGLLTTSVNLPKIELKTEGLPFRTGNPHLGESYVLLPGWFSLEVLPEVALFLPQLSRPSFLIWSDILDI